MSVTIQRINYRSDIPPVNITFTLSGIAAPIPQHDFILRFYTADESRHYDCRYIGGECENLSVDRENNSVTAYIKNHGLGLGHLRAIFIALENAPGYEDGIKRTFAVSPLKDIILIDGNGDEVESIDAEMSVNLTSLITSLNNAEAERIANENARIANENARGLRLDAIEGDIEELQSDVAALGAGKQDNLVSGVNIKELHSGNAPGVSLLGIGAVDIATIDGVSVLEHSNIALKTINGEHLTGSDNITLPTESRVYSVYITENGDDTYTADKTFDEVAEAMTTKLVEYRIGHSRYTVCNHSANKVFAAYLDGNTAYFLEHSKSGDGKGISLTVTPLATEAELSERLPLAVTLTQSGDAWTSSMKINDVVAAFNDGRLILLQVNTNRINRIYRVTRYVQKLGIGYVLYATCAEGSIAYSLTWDAQGVVEITESPLPLVVTVTADLELAGESYVTDYTAQEVYNALTSGRQVMYRYTGTGAVFVVNRYTNVIPATQPLADAYYEVCATSMGRQSSVVNRPRMLQQLRHVYVQNSIGGVSQSPTDRLTIDAAEQLALDNDVREISSSLPLVVHVTRGALENSADVSAQEVYAALSSGRVVVYEVPPIVSVGQTRKEVYLATRYQFTSINGSYSITAMKAEGAVIDTLTHGTTASGGEVLTISTTALAAIDELYLGRASTIDVSALTEQQASLGSGKKWYWNGTNGKHKAVPLRKGATYTIKATAGTFYGLVTLAYSTPVNNNAVIPFIADNDRKWVEADTEVTLTPSDEAAYLILCTRDGGGNAATWAVAELYTADAPQGSVINDINNTLARLRMGAQYAPTIASGVYYGEKIDVAEHTFSYEQYMTAASESGNARQGAACYGSTLFMFHSTNDIVDVFDLANKTRLQTIRMAGGGIHCNTANFGSAKYDASDPFPLLYVSNGGIQAWRITGTAGAYEFSLIQQISLNGGLDVYIAQDGTMWQIGYGGGAGWNVAAQGGYIRFRQYALPDPTDENPTIDGDSYLREIRAPWRYSLQGSFIRDGKLYFLWGGAGNSGIDVFNLATGELVTAISLSGNGFSNEPEAVFAYNGKLYITAFNTNNIYQLNT